MTEGRKQPTPPPTDQIKPDPPPAPPPPRNGYGRPPRPCACGCGADTSETTMAVWVEFFDPATRTQCGPPRGKETFFIDQKHRDAYMSGRARPRPNTYEAHLTQRLETSGVPEHFHGGLVRYLTARIRPGGFLVAVLENDLRQAVARIDPEHRPAIYALVFFLHNYAPGNSWGSPTHVALWLADPQPPPEVFE